MRKIMKLVGHKREYFECAFCRDKAIHRLSFLNWYLYLCDKHLKQWAQEALEIVDKVQEMK